MFQGVCWDILSLLLSLGFQASGEKFFFFPACMWVISIASIAIVYMAPVYFPTFIIQINQISNVGNTIPYMDGYGIVAIITFTTVDFGSPILDTDERQH